MMLMARPLGVRSMGKGPLGRSRSLGSWKGNPSRPSAGVGIGSMVGRAGFEPATTRFRRSEGLSAVCSLASVVNQAEPPARGSLSFGLGLIIVFPEYGKAGRDGRGLRALGSQPSCPPFAFGRAQRAADRGLTEEVAEGGGRKSPRPGVGRLMPYAFPHSLGASGTG
jgi:hypothetical protein